MAYRLNEQRAASFPARLPPLRRGEIIVRRLKNFAGIVSRAPSIAQYRRAY